MNKKEELAEKIWGNIPNVSQKELHRMVSELGRVSEDLKCDASLLASYFLPHGDGAIRHAALVSIMELDDIDTHLEQILEMLDDMFPMVREAAVIALGRCKSDTKEKLLSLVDNENPEVRYQVPISLVEKNYFDTAQVLVDHLKTEGDNEIRINILAALGDMNFTQALDTVHDFIDNNVYEILRFEAAYTSARLGSTYAFNFLLKYSSHAVYGEQAISALEMMTLSEEQIPVLVKTLKNKFRRPFLSTERRISLGSLLARYGESVFLDFAGKKTTSFSFQTRVHAFEKLGHTKSIKAIKYLDRKNFRTLQEMEVAVSSLLNIANDLTEFGSDIGSIKQIIKNWLTKKEFTEYAHEDTLRDMKALVNHD
ncbi:MAG: HEAT repeat domain-containing protein [Deltaproteobacteria bacterium]|nr:HEAT repeat domain-containing protein [Deltaproteobacteria bacterium]